MDVPAIAADTPLGLVSLRRAAERVRTGRRTGGFHMGMRGPTLAQAHAKQNSNRKLCVANDVANALETVVTRHGDGLVFFF